MKATSNILGVLFALFLSVATSGCMTGIIEKPDLKKLAYDKNGVLRYDGQKVEGVKIELPWYKEMWPDNGPEWGFAAVTVGITAIAAGGGGGGGGATSGNRTATVTTPTATTSVSGGGGDDNSDSSATVPTITVSTEDGGGGGESSGGSTPDPSPPSGGDEEVPW